MVDQNESGTKPLNKRQRSKIETREAVLDAGLKLFKEGSYEQAVIRDIAKEAGKSTGAVFANFKDKVDLLHKVVERELKSFDGLVSVAAQEEGSVLDRIVRVCVADYEFFGERFQLMEALTRIEAHPELSKSIPAQRLADQRRGNLLLRVKRLLRTSRFGNEKEVEAISVIMCNAHLDACRHSTLRNWDTETYQVRLKELFSFIVFPNGVNLAA